MGNIYFSENEIVELGVQIEKNGKDFYNTLAAKFKDEKVKEICKFLAEQEEKHIGIFSKILESVDKSASQPRESYAGESSAYMNALANGNVFTQKNKGNEVAKAVKNEKDALDVALGFEKDSIVFFEGMKKIIPQKNHKSINWLIEEEQKHIVQLFDLRNKLKT
ncbi:MAG: ferritin family protein [Candidatus Firestonebacteria bacterium]